MRNVKVASTERPGLTHLVLCVVLQPDAKERFESIHVLQELST